MNASHSLRTTQRYVCILFVPTGLHLLQEVFKSRGLNEMSDDALAFVLRSDRLRLDEAEILEKVLEWATVNSVSNKPIH